MPLHPAGDLVGDDFGVLGADPHLLSLDEHQILFVRDVVLQHTGDVRRVGPGAVGVKDNMPALQQPIAYRGPVPPALVGERWSSWGPSGSSPVTSETPSPTVAVFHHVAEVYFVRLCIAPRSRPEDELSLCLLDIFCTTCQQTLREALHHLVVLLEQQPARTRIYSGDQTEKHLILVLQTLKAVEMGW